MQTYRNGNRRQSLHAYHLYGLCIRSQWRLPFCECSDASLPGVELVEGPARLFEEASQGAASQPNATDWYQSVCLHDGSYYLRWSRLFEFLVSADGRRIAGRPLADLSFESFHTYLLGVVLSFSLLKRGLDPLHATAVVVDGKAVGFLGDTGYGKSSLGAAFLQAGYPLLTDDLLIVRNRAHGFSAYSGPPRIKLFPEIAKTLLGEQATGIPMNPLTPKLIIPLDRHQSHKGPVPLRALYALPRPSAGARSRRLTLRRLSQRGAFLTLLKSTFNDEVVEPERLRHQFLLCARIASTIPMKLLSHPRSLASLPLVREAILSDLTR